VLKFLRVTAAARLKWSGLRKYWVATAALAVLIIAVIAVTIWSIGGKGAVHYVTVPATRGAITRTAAATGTVNPVLTIIVGSSL
jgi:HlyD family secretion protein